MLHPRNRGLIGAIHLESDRKPRGITTCWLAQVRVVAMNQTGEQAVTSENVKTLKTHGFRVQNGAEREDFL